MSTDRNNFSSDLDQARQIAHRLGRADHGRPPASPAGRAPSPPPPYVCFSARLLVASAYASLEADASPAPAGFWSDFGVASWHRVLDRCLEITGATTAFVMDAQGLVVACRGRLSADEVQGIGARLLVIFEQADQMDAGGHPAASVVIELTERYLTGVRCAVPTAASGASSFALGLVGPAPLGSETRATVTWMLAQR